MADRLGAASKTVQQCAQIIFRSRISRPQPEGLLKIDRKSTRLNSSHGYISYAVFCLKKKKKQQRSRVEDRNVNRRAIMSHRLPDSVRDRPQCVTSSVTESLLSYCDTPAYADPIPLY